MESNPVEYGTCLSFLCIFESVIKTMFLQTDTHSVASPSLLLLQPPPLPACEPRCDVIIHRKFLIKWVREGEKKLAREGDKQRLLWWELEMADERSCVEKDFLPRNNYSAFSFVLLHDSRWALSTTSSAPTTQKKLHLRLVFLSAALGAERNFPLWLTHQHNGTLTKWCFSLSACYYESSTNRTGGV